MPSTLAISQFIARALSQSIEIKRQVHKHSQPQASMASGSKSTPADRLLADIKRSHQSGRRKRTQFIIRRFLDSYSARLTATTKAYRSLPPKRRPPAAELPNIAKSLSWREGTDERVKVFFKQKCSDPVEFRATMDFEIRNRALQYLVVEALTAQSDLCSSQFLLNGGRQAAVLAVRKAIVDGYTWAMEVDIRHCYQSFKEEQIASLLPLPKEATENVILSRDLKLFPGNTWVGLDCIEEEVVAFFGEAIEEVRRGIPQGSAASPIVAELLLSPLIAELEKFGTVINYVDNILLLGKTKEEVVSMQKALWSMLSMHPAGPLVPKPAVLCEPGHALQFLGYSISLSPESCTIQPTPTNLKKFQRKYGSLTKRAISASVPPELAMKLLMTLKCYVKSWSACFELWSDADAHCKHHLAGVDEAITLLPAKQSKGKSSSQVQVIDTCKSV